jgi:hypothetical protein
MDLAQTRMEILKELDPNFRLGNDRQGEKD